MAALYKSQGQDEPALRLQGVAGQVVPLLQFEDSTGATLAPATYAATNVTTDRTFDANATTTDELADVLGTLIADLRARGLVS